MGNRNLDKADGDYYPGYRHPKLLIGYVVWSYHGFYPIFSLNWQWHNNLNY
jgi:hypothetical protein